MKENDGERLKLLGLSINQGVSYQVSKVELLYNWDIEIQQFFFVKCPYNLHI